MKKLRHRQVMKLCQGLLGGRASMNSAGGRVQRSLENLYSFPLKKISL
jgi:hypothetical protein